MFGLGGACIVVSGKKLSKLNSVVVNGIESINFYVY